MGSLGSVRQTPPAQRASPRPSTRPGTTRSAVRPGAYLDAPRSMTDTPARRLRAAIFRRGILFDIPSACTHRALCPDGFPPELRMGHRVTLAARRRNVIVRPLGDVVVLMPAPAMPGELIDTLCDMTIQSIEEATTL